jgi:hypothetical protein
LALSGVSDPARTGVAGMIRYNSSTPAVEGYVNGSWLAFTTGSLSTINLGTSATTTNSQRSGDATTGFYTPNAQQVAVSANGIEAMQWNTVASAVNYLSITPGATGATPTITATGTDTNIGIQLVMKGTGTLQVPAVNSQTTASARERQCRCFPQPEKEHVVNALQARHPSV